MTKREIVTRNIGLTFDFMRQALKKPALLDNIPNGSVLEFVEKDFVKKKRTSEEKEILKKYLRVQSRLEVI